MLHRRFALSVGLVLLAVAPAFAEGVAERGGSGEPPIDVTGTSPAGDSPAGAPAEAQPPPFEWEVGPTTSQIGPMAHIDLPAGYRFTGAKGTKMLLEIMGNPAQGNELGLIAPEDEAKEWFLVFEFRDLGYVEDDDKDDLDADALLESIQEGNRAANELRKERGWTTIDVVGWQVPPKYNELTNNLEWGILGRSGEAETVNFNTRILGRRGVMAISLVTDPQALGGTLPEFRKLLGSFEYVEGHRYADFSKGDRVAEYGLAALVAGGAAAVALKSGLFKKFFKFILLGVVAIGAFVKKLFFGGASESSDQETA